MSSPIPLRAWLERQDVIAGTTIEASDDDATPVVCLMQEDGTWLITPIRKFAGSSLAHWVGSSNNATVKLQWESLVECLRRVHDVLPVHVVNESCEREVKMYGDDLDALLWHADTALTLIDSHEFDGMNNSSGSYLCGECLTPEDSPSHLDADEMVRRGEI